MNYILETLGKVGFEWQMGLFNLINFLIIFFILKKFFFASVTKTINERQLKAKEAVENFERAKTELGMATKKSQEIIDGAKVEANKIVEKASDESKAESERNKEKAKKEIEMLVTQAKKNIEIDKKEMKEEISKETANLVVAAVEKIIGEKMDQKKDTKIIEETLTELN